MSVHHVRLLLLLLGRLRLRRGRRLLVVLELLVLRLLLLVVPARQGGGGVLDVGVEDEADAVNIEVPLVRDGVRKLARVPAQAPAREEEPAWLRGVGLVGRGAAGCRGALVRVAAAVRGWARAVAPRAAGGVGLLLAAVRARRDGSAGAPHPRVVATRLCSSGGRAGNAGLARDGRALIKHSSLRKRYAVSARASAKCLVPRRNGALETHAPERKRDQRAMHVGESERASEGDRFGNRTHRFAEEKQGSCWQAPASRTAALPQ
mmetsp:Transcript_43881/g.135464  ORF Transcript_43881/g.135464 Transcript_43881/m.135464 type:complete len:263 (-) Transcript_43881:17-805(-)